MVGTSVNWACCKQCEKTFGIVLEWKSRKSAIEEIKKTKCPECKSENWYFTDSMGQ